MSTWQDKQPKRIYVIQLDISLHWYILYRERSKITQHYNIITLVLTKSVNNTHNYFVSVFVTKIRKDKQLIYNKHTFQKITT